MSCDIKTKYQVMSQMKNRTLAIDAKSVSVYLTELRAQYSSDIYQQTDKQFE